MGSHGLTCHLTQVNIPRLNPEQKQLLSRLQRYNYTEKTTELPVVVTQLGGSPTVPALQEAPASINVLRQSTCPFAAAKCSAVNPYLFTAFTSAENIQRNKHTSLKVSNNKNDYVSENDNGNRSLSQTD